MTETLSGSGDPAVAPTPYCEEPSAGPKQRRSGRLSLAVPILVIGTNDEGRVFSEQTHGGVKPPWRRNCVPAKARCGAGIDFASAGVSPGSRSACGGRNREPSRMAHLWSGLCKRGTGFLGSGVPTPAGAGGGSPYFGMRRLQTNRGIEGW